jgi:two-component system sensor histidine kinase BaeS
MLCTGAVGVGLTYVVVGNIEHSRETSADRAKARVVARAIAAQAARGASPAAIARVQAVLPNDQVIVTRGGRVLFTGPPRLSRDVEVSVSAPFPGGRVRVIDHESITSGAPTAAVASAIAVAALVLTAALALSSMITSSVREPVERAIWVSDRIAAGDLSARMGASGPDALSSLGAAIDEMARRLELEDRERRRFLADVAHEIATPINTIVGYAEAVADGTVAGQEERERARRAIEGAGDRLTRLLADLRQLTSLDLYGDIHGEPVELATLCDDLVARWRPAATAEGIAIAVDVPAICLTSDRRLLETVLDNLLSNAIRYTPRDGRVSLTAGRQADAVRITVADTGVGIPPEHQLRIFDHLYRVDEARHRATGGLGLGLSITRRAVEALGGAISVRSTPGEGSAFTVLVPLVVAGAPAPASPGAAPSG